MAGFKMLAARRGIDTRDEVRIMGDATWSSTKTYEFKITWDSLTASCYLDGRKCHTLPFRGQKELFRYIFLGADNVYNAQPGVIYSNLRICGPAEAAVEDSEFPAVPSSMEMQLFQNYPNPFNPDTRLSFYLPESDRTILDIYDLQGRLTVRLLDAVLPAGRQWLQWTSRDEFGRVVPAGVYFFRLRSGDRVQSRKMIFLP